MKRLGRFSFAVLALLASNSAWAQISPGTPGLVINNTPISGGSSGQCLFINSGQLSSQACGGVPSGAAGGALAGTYPNPTLASTITAGGPTGSATVAPIITYNAAGQLTAVSSATVTPAVGSVTGLGTGVATALGVNVGSAGAFVALNGALGTPSSGTGTNLTGTAVGLTAGNVTTNANLTGDVTSVGNATTLATVNSNVGTFGSATSCVTVTNNAKGLTTAISAATCAPAIGSITGLGSGAATALGNAVNGSGGVATLTSANTLGFTNAVASGGTGDTGSAWTNYTPSATCGQATGTTVCTGTGSYKTLGKTVWVQIAIAVSGTFTGGTLSAATLPVAVNGALQYTLACRDSGQSGNAWTATASAGTSSVALQSYANVTTVLTGANVVCSGVYQSS